MCGKKHTISKAASQFRIYTFTKFDNRTQKEKLLYFFNIKWMKGDWIFFFKQLKNYKQLKYITKKN